jgi:hypothetical protein
LSTELDGRRFDIRLIISGRKLPVRFQSFEDILECLKLGLSGRSAAKLPMAAKGAFRSFVVKWLICALSGRPKLDS